MLLAEMTSLISHALQIQQFQKAFRLLKDAQPQQVRPQQCRLLAHSSLDVNLLAHTMVDQIQIGGNPEINSNIKDT